MEVQGAVMAVHRALEARRIPHLIFGRYAVELALCEEPDGVDLPSPVVAILVDGNQRHVINIIITSSPLFTYSEADGLRYIPVICFSSPLLIHLHWKSGLTLTIWVIRTLVILVRIQFSLRFLRASESHIVSLQLACPPGCYAPSILSMKSRFCTQRCT